MERPNEIHRVKVKKGMSGSSVAILVLSLILGASVAIGITIAYFTNIQNATGTITLGDPVTISITQGGSVVTTLTFPGTAMPGTVYDAPIAIAAAANTSETCIRAKITLTNIDTATYNVEAATDLNWTVGTDDYYYYNGTLLAGNSASFVSTITVPTTLTNADANKTYEVAVIAEAVQYANGAAVATWPTAPEAWKTTYGGA